MESGSNTSVAQSPSGRTLNSLTTIIGIAAFCSSTIATNLEKITKHSYSDITNAAKKTTVGKQTLKSAKKLKIWFF